MQQKEQTLIFNEEMSMNLAKVFDQYHTIINKIIAKQINSETIPGFVISHLSKSLNKVISSIFSDPDKLIFYQAEYVNKSISIINNTINKFMGEETKDLHSPSSKDLRFRDDSWQHNIIFDFIKQAYLMTSDWVVRLVDDVNDLDHKTHSQAKFYVKQILDAFSPTNFILTNPIVLKETLESNAKNLVVGMEKMIQDIEKSKRIIDISTNNTSAFKIGINIANTQGKVIFQNDIIQLIHYHPTCDKNYTIPLLIVPPCINKFYILDLNEKKSFVKYLLDQGYSLFLISWINPSKELSEKSFENYVQEGVLEAIDVVKKAAKVKKINVMGYCLGGTILAFSLAYLSAKKNNSVNSATFLTTLVDFKDAGDLSLFIDEEQILAIEKKMELQGYFDGIDMFEIFNLLRANDMIWNCFINNYLLGKDPVTMEVLYWNSDSTRLPAKMFSYYLRNMYQNNLLIQTNSLNINNQALDLKKIDCDCYFLACKEDHITPWDAVYNGIKNFKSNIKFVLAGSGHVAGVTNHPNQNKYCYMINENISENAQNWILNSVEYKGSWWNNYNEWLKSRSGKKRKSINPENTIMKIIEDAPGSYVKMK